MGEALFSVRRGPIYHCDKPDCQNWPNVEVRLIDADNHLGHDQVCERHVTWAKADLVKRQKAADQE